MQLIKPFKLCRMNIILNYNRRLINLYHMYPDTMVFQFKKTLKKNTRETNRNLNTSVDLKTDFCIYTSDVKS